MAPGPLLAAWLLAAPASAADPVMAACSAAYKDSYASDWGLEKKAWLAACAKRTEPDDILIAWQRGTMANCVARFLPYEKTKKLNPGEAQALCAQGEAGRSRLEEATGLHSAKPAAAPPAPALPPIKPGDSKLGPLSAALGVAQSQWKPDACFSGLYYKYIESKFIAVSEWEAAKRAGRAPASSPVDLEEYAYYFHSDSSAADQYRVSFGDELDAAFCYKVKRMDGPDSLDVPPVSGLDSCLSGVDVDLGKALAAATAGGFHVEAPMKAFLGSLPSGFFERACGKHNAGSPVPCSKLRGWDAGKLRRVTGRPVWVLTTADKTAFVDAKEGALRFIGDGPFDLRAAKSYKYAEPCAMNKSADSFSP